MSEKLGFSYRVYLSPIFIHTKTEHINIQLIVSTFRIYKVHNCATKIKNMTSYRQNVLLTQKLLKILQKSGTQLIAPPVVNIRLNLTISQNIIVKECIFLNLFTELKNIDFVKSYRVSNFSLHIIWAKNQFPVHLLELSLLKLLIKFAVYFISSKYHMLGYENDN